MTRQIVPYEPEPEALVGEIVRPYFKPPSGKRGMKLAESIMSAPGLADVLMQLHLADAKVRGGKIASFRRDAVVEELCVILRKAAKKGGRVMAASRSPPGDAGKAPDLTDEDRRALWEDYADRKMHEMDETPRC